MWKKKPSKLTERDQVVKYFDQLHKEKKVTIFGTVSVQRVFDSMPGGRYHQRRLIHRLTARVEEKVSDADKQIRDMRETLSIPHALGVLVLINEVSLTLTKERLEYRLLHLLKHDNKPNTVSYPNTDFIIVLSELHPLRISQTTIIPVRTYVNSATRQKSAALAFGEKFTTNWAAFNRVPLIRVQGTI